MIKFPLITDIFFNIRRRKCIMSITIFIVTGGCIRLIWMDMWLTSLLFPFRAVQVTGRLGSLASRPLNPHASTLEFLFFQSSGKLALILFFRLWIPEMIISPIFLLIRIRHRIVFILIQSECQLCRALTSCIKKMNLWLILVHRWINHWLDCYGII